jgi:hypothetical protein
MTFPTLQFPLYGLTDEIRSFLAVIQYGVHSTECPSREPSGNLFLIYAFSPHLDPLICINT